MALQDVINAQLPVYSNGVTAVVTTVITNSYNQGLADQAAADGSAPSPTDAATIANLQQQLAAMTAQDQSDVAAGQVALSAANAQVSSLQTQLATVTATEGADAAVIQGFQSSVSQLSAALAALQAIISPPAPAPDVKKK